MIELHGSPSHLRGTARLAWRALRERGDAPADTAVPRRRIAVEWRGTPARTRNLAAYLAVTAGEGLLHDPAAGTPLPPLYPVVWETALVLDLLAGMPGLKPLGGLIHRASERLQLRPLSASDPVRCRIELDRVEPTARGVQLSLISRNWTEAGQLCSQGEMLVLVRDRGGSGRRSGTSLRRREDGEGDLSSRLANGPPADSRELVHWALRGNHGRRYARVSGDYNPIHLWSWTARPFGYRHPILHGYCTEAMVAHALVNGLWESDPGALRRLQIGFRKPLFLPARVRLMIHEEDATRGLFWLVDGGKDEGRVYAEGSYGGG